MIQLDNVSKKFEQRGIAGVNGVSLKLHPGEVLAVMGPNGSGKTTLINLITGAIRPDSGNIKLEGPAVVFTRAEEATGNVQKYLIAQNTQNIEEDKKLQLARDFADIFEFTFQLRQDLSQLSAGQRQKVALAAALINRPAIFLMDEPFTHLDPHTRKDILKSLFQYIKTQEISLLWVTHDLEEALNFSDRLGILNFGKLEQLEAPLNIVQSPRNLFVAQFMGYANFLTIKNGESPWGSLPSNLEDSILVMPNDALYMSNDGIKARVVSQKIANLKRLVELEFMEKSLFMELPRSAADLQIGKSVSIMARLNDCFIIPL